MLDTLEQDVRLRYFLGELSVEEQVDIEARYFADDKFFEEMLKLEEDLIQVSLGGESADEVLLSRIQRLPEIEFAKQWVPKIREMIAEPWSCNESASAFESYGDYFSAQPMALQQSPDLSEGSLLLSLINSYESRIREGEQVIEQQQAESLLCRSWQDRELASALLQSSGLGLRILSALKPGGLSASGLTDAVGVDTDSVAPLLAKLVQFGGARVQDGLFSITDRGAEIVRNLELAIQSSL